MKKSVFPSSCQHISTQGTHTTTRFQTSTHLAVCLCNFFYSTGGFVHCTDEKCCTTQINLLKLCFFSLLFCCCSSDVMRKLHTHPVTMSDTYMKMQSEKENELSHRFWLICSWKTFIAYGFQYFIKYCFTKSHFFSSVSFPSMANCKLIFVADCRYADANRNSRFEILNSSFKMQPYRFQFSSLGIFLFCCMLRSHIAISRNSETLFSFAWGEAKIVIEIAFGGIYHTIIGSLLWMKFEIVFSFPI